MNNSEIEKLLAPQVLKWISEQGWKELRPIQQDAIAPILSKSSDVIITAATAGGKTEAAFLPIFSDICQKQISGLHTLCISPLIALIRDQYRRLQQIGDCCNTSVTPWNGDVPQNVKNKFLTTPTGILIITPESLEAFLMRRSHLCRYIFSELQYIVVDELHSFMGTERGRQLQSLLHRLTKYCQNSPTRIGLSATLYSMDSAFEYLSGREHRSRVLVTDRNEKRSLRLALKHLTATDFITSLTQEIYNRYRGGSHLIFSNSRQLAECLGDQLREQCEQNNVPNEFFVHHGNLSKTFREGIERNLRLDDKPSTVICTSTLELGIDIGNIDTVAQIGIAPSVSSLRQRLGRSGRESGIPTLRIYTTSAKQPEQEKSLYDLLHWDFFHTIAQVELLLEKWFEPQNFNEYGFSTLVQQVLSVVYQYGEVSAGDLWKFLCRDGIFKAVDFEDFSALIQNLIRLNILKYSTNNLLVLAPGGEKITSDYDFYSVFCTTDEYTLMHQGIAIGQYTNQIPSSNTIIFAGLRWKIEKIDKKSKIITILPAQQGSLPSFSSSSEHFFHKGVREKVHELYTKNICPKYLNAEAQSAFYDAVNNFHLLGLDTHEVIFFNDFCYWIPWQGDCRTHQLSLCLRLQGLNASDSYGIISIAGSPAQVAVQTIMHLQQQKFTVAELLSIDDYYPQRPKKKYDYLLPESLKKKEYSLFMYKF